MGELYFFFGTNGGVVLLYTDGGVKLINSKIIKRKKELKKKATWKIVELLMGS